MVLTAKSYLLLSRAVNYTQTYNDLSFTSRKPELRFITIGFVNYHLLSFKRWWQKASSKVLAWSELWLFSMPYGAQRSAIQASAHSDKGSQSRITALISCTSYKGGHYPKSLHRDSLNYYQLSTTTYHAQGAS